MWLPKWQRDQNRGVDSPVPTQVVSNEEFVPRPQNKQQKQWEALIGELSEEKARRLGMPRRDFMRTSMGMATAFLASNMVYGPYWDVEAAETLEPAATEEKFPKGEYFIMDVQNHFTDGVALRFRQAEFVRNMGFDLKNDADAYSFTNFVKEIFFDSETSISVISGVPGREINKNLAGQILEGRDRRGGILPSWLMSQRKNELNNLAGGTRAFCQGNCAPNHYWDRARNAPDFPALFEQMEREVKLYGIDSWKWYCHTDPGRSGDGFRMDEEDMAYPFYEKSKELGLKVFSVHKGYAAQSRTLGHYAHPGDLEKTAIDHPDITFIAYHSALKHGPGEPAFGRDGFYDPTTGDFEWHADLMSIKERNPEIDNIYPEIGSAFGSLAIAHPEMCMHLIGKNVKHYGSDHVIWGTDCLWWGSPQWVIDAMKRFQISDALCERFGYEKLTKRDKANIFGLNAAKVYGLDLEKELKAMPGDALTRLKTAYLESGGQRDNAVAGWVRGDA
ncbi:MAG: amidohydrolase family protein [Planctomycetota bacterium]|jgi:predicted TIM-barrel fold metal-dependent hydrolase